MITIRKRGSLEDPCHFPQTHFASTQISNSGSNQQFLKKMNDDDDNNNYDDDDDDNHEDDDDHGDDDSVRHFDTSC